MNIVFVGPFGLQPKGTMSVRALPLAKALVCRGHSVTVLIPPWDDPDRSGCVWDEDGVQLVNVSLPRQIPLIFHLALARRLVNRALALKPDVVHFFKPKAYAGLAHVLLWGIRWFGAAKLRLVLDTDDWEQAWNDIEPYSAAQKRLFAWQEQWGLKHADAITTASQELSRLAAQVRGEPVKIHYVPNGYRPAAAAAFQSLPAEAGDEVRTRWQLGEAPLVLLYTRFAEFRLERIVTLVQRVAQACPQARWLVVGQGLQNEEQRLVRRLASAGLAEPYVRFSGWLPVDQLPAIFAAADVAIHPYDNTPINRTKCSVKLIDLLMAGLPVVADAVGQNSEYIQPDVSGILVPAEDDIAFAAAVIALLQSPEKRRRLGRAARQHVFQNFDWAELAQRAEQAYR